MSTPSVDLNEFMSLITSSEAGLTPEQGQLILEDLRSLEAAVKVLGAGFKSDLMKEVYSTIELQLFTGLKTFKAMILVAADLT